MSAARPPAVDVLTVLDRLDLEYGTGVGLVAEGLGHPDAKISAALQRLKRKGLAECAFGSAGWSWFATEQGMRIIEQRHREADERRARKELSE